MAFEHLIEDERDLEQRPVRIGACVGSKVREGFWLEELLDGPPNVGEAAQHDSPTRFGDPFGVIALLRHGLLIALDDHREMELQGFTDAAGTGLPDEEVR